MTDSTYLPRPRSLFGPLLIAIGALWLLSAFDVIASGNVWSVLRFWPVLLIALGVDALLRWRWPMAANVVDVVFVALVVGAVIFAPRLGLPAASGWIGTMPFALGGQPASGEVISEDRAVSDFEAVDFSSLGDLTIVPGPREGLTIEAEADVMRHIRTEVRGGTLYISFDEDGQAMTIYPTRPIRLTLTVVKLEAVDLSGAGNITVNDLTAERLQTRLSGAGNLALRALEAEALVCDLSGAGGLSAAGTVNELDVDVSGVGNFDGASLESQRADVSLSGLGGASVWAIGHLNVTISGLGSITYYGQPGVDQTISGLGTVRSAGNK